MSDITKKLDRVFGEDSQGVTAFERAKSSQVVFVRSQDELFVYCDGAKGKKLTALEALDSFGLDVLDEAVVKGSAILVDSREEPSRSFNARRSALGISIEALSRKSGLSVDTINDIENPQKKNPIRYLERAAQFLGLDERKITFQRGLNGDNQLALRLKDLSSSQRGLSPKTVISLNEAAWIIAVEDRLRKRLDLLNASKTMQPFTRHDDYGDAGHPAWRIGYDLAERTRHLLGLNANEPINSLRELCVERLAMPVVRCELPNHIAGATVANNASRGIVINDSGHNTNEWVRRATVAHELGHLLWDPEQKLEKIKVDDYDEMDKGWTSTQEVDYVEQRANAFAAEFLLPKDAAVSLYHSSGLRAVMEKYGVSFTLARYQVWNGSHRTEDLHSITVDNADPRDDWKGRESFTADYFPVSNVPLSRRGYFAGLVALAEREKLISVDTAIQYLLCAEDDYVSNRDALISVFDLDQR